MNVPSFCELLKDLIVFSCHTLPWIVIENWYISCKAGQKYLLSKSRNEWKKPGENSIITWNSWADLLYEYNFSNSKSMINNSSHIIFNVLIKPTFHLVICTREKMGHIYINSRQLTKQIVTEVRFSYLKLIFAWNNTFRNCSWA